MKKCVTAMLLIGLVATTGVSFALTGSGTSTNPYLIQSLADFDEFSGNPSYWSSGVHTRLMCDIDLSGRTYDRAVIAYATDDSTWGFSGTFYEGIFAGNGHTIKNLVIHSGGNDRYYVGLFGRLRFNSTTKITNLSLENISINIGSGSGCAGGLVGSIYNEVTIQNCRVTGTIRAGDWTGGLIGEATWALVYESACDVDVTGGTGVGGFIGSNSFCIIYDCYSKGNVSGNDRVGGFTGENGTGWDQYHIKRCYSSGSVAGATNTGGFIGSNDNGLVTACFWDTQTSGTTTSAGGTGKTTVEMKTKSTFSGAGWNFVNVWKMSADDGYPELEWQGSVDTGTPDLTVEQKTSGVISCTGGATVSLPVLVRNSGSGDAIPSFEGYFDTTAYISGTQSVNWDALGENASIAEAERARLNAGSSVNATLRFTAPSTAGTYYVRVIADDFDCVQEENEQNNWSEVIVLNVTSTVITGPSVQVIIQPEQVTPYARWQVGFVSPYEGPFESGYEFAHSPGEYHQYIYFNEVPGWKTPERISYDVRGTQRNKFTVKYIPLYPTEIQADGEIRNFKGQDFDGDGYFNTFEFEIGVKCAVNYGKWPLRARIICSTGQTWWMNLMAAEEQASQYTYQKFRNDAFVGFVPNETDLTFSVEIWDPEAAQRYATIDSIANGSIAADSQISNLVVSSIVTKTQRNGDDKWYVGDKYPVQVYVGNEGSVRIQGNVTLQLWACAGSAIDDATDCLLGEVDKKLTINPGAYTRVTFNKVCIPLELGTGRMYGLGVRILPEQALQETEAASDNSHVYRDILEVAREIYDLAVSFTDTFRTKELKVKDRLLSLPIRIYNRGTTPVNLTVTTKLYLRSADLSQSILLGQTTDTIKLKKSMDKLVKIKNASAEGISGDWYLYAAIEPDVPDEILGNNVSRSLYRNRLENGFMVDLSDWCKGIATDVSKLKVDDIQNDDSSSVTLADARSVINGDYDDFANFDTLEKAKKSIIQSLNKLYGKNSGNTSFLWILSLDFDMQFATDSSFHDKKLDKLLDETEVLLSDIVSENDPYAKAILIGKLRYYQREIQREIFLMHAIMKKNKKEAAEALNNFIKLSRADYLHARIPMPTTNTPFGVLYDDMDRIYQLIPQLTAKLTIIADDGFQEMIFDVSRMPLEEFMEGTMGVIGVELGMIGDLVSFPVSIYKYGTIQKNIVETTEEIGLGMMDDALNQLKIQCPNGIDTLLSDADETLMEIEAYLEGH